MGNRAERERNLSYPTGRALYKAFKLSNYAGYDSEQIEKIQADRREEFGIDS